MTIELSEHIWSSDSLLKKAQRYAELMLECDQESWQFGFWSTLQLELLCRASLANVATVLIADPKDWNNLLYALGREPTANKFQAKSIDVSEVFSRLEKILPEFTAEMLGYCLHRMNSRNSELHTGDLAFEGVKNSSWLPMHYAICKVLLASMGHGLDLLLGDDRAYGAEKLIEANDDENAKVVAKTINAHSEVWKEKAPEDQAQLLEEAKAWASRRFGHRCICPSCQAVGLIHGEPISAPTRSLTEALSVVEKRTMLPSRFECVACKLKIDGISRLKAAGLGDTYTETADYSFADYYELAEQAEFDPEAYFDYNE